MKSKQKVLYLKKKKSKQKVTKSKKPHPIKQKAISPNELSPEPNKRVVIVFPTAVDQENNPQTESSSAFNAPIKNPPTTTTNIVVINAPSEPASVLRKR